ncbi:MAG: DUF4159 domain-containing protein, partial [Clostridia bacterium]|nr:DUF4159 domain-containing protein [Clostridia bacterium]
MGSMNCPFFRAFSASGCPSVSINKNTGRRPPCHRPAYRFPQGSAFHRTGHDAFSFTPEIRERLRAYLAGGGTLILEACCGRRAFVESALREVQ